MASRRRRGSVARENATRVTMLYVSSEGLSVARASMSSMSRSATGAASLAVAGMGGRSGASLGRARTRSQKSAKTGCSKRSFGRTAAPSHAPRRLQTKAAESEWPPRWKKWLASPMPAAGVLSPSAQRPRILPSSSSSAASSAPPWCAVGSGRRARSILPLTLSANASTRTRKAGTM